MAQRFSTFGAAWLSDKLHCAVTRVTIVESEKPNDSSDLCFASAETADGAIIKLVMKVGVQDHPATKLFGLPREAYFY